VAIVISQQDTSTLNSHVQNEAAIANITRECPHANLLIIKFNTHTYIYETYIYETYIYETYIY